MRMKIQFRKEEHTSRMLFPKCMVSYLLQVELELQRENNTKPRFKRLSYVNTALTIFNKELQIENHGED